MSYSETADLAGLFELALRSRMAVVVSDNDAVILACIDVTQAKGCDPLDVYRAFAITHARSAVGVAVADGKEGR